MLKRVEHDKHTSRKFVFQTQLLHTSQTEEAHFYYVHQTVVTYLCQTQIHFSSGSPHRRQERPHPMYTGGYVFVSSCMHRRPPPKNPIKGCVLPSKVSQSLALESSTSQNFSCDQPLDYAIASSPA